MSSPQKENGYTAIANELLLAIISTDIKLSGSDFRVLLFIANQTYGYNHKKWRMSATYISNATGLSVRQVRRSISYLIECSLITVYETEKSANVIGINKDYKRWSNGDNSVTVTELSPCQTCPQNSDNLVTVDGDNLVTQNNKDRTRKNNNKEYCACAFFDQLWNEYPNKKGKARVSKKSMEAMNKIGYEEMHRALERYKAEKPDWQQWQNGSTFFNSGYVDYLDATYTATAEVETEEHNGKHNDDLQQWCTDGLI